MNVQLDSQKLKVQKYDAIGVEGRRVFQEILWALTYSGPDRSRSHNNNIYYQIAKQEEKKNSGRADEEFRCATGRSFSG